MGGWMAGWVGGWMDEWVGKAKVTEIFAVYL